MLWEHICIGFHKDGCIVLSVVSLPSSSASYPTGFDTCWRNAWCDSAGNDGRRNIHRLVFHCAFDEFFRKSSFFSVGFRCTDADRKWSSVNYSFLQVTSRIEFILKMSRIHTYRSSPNRDDLQKSSGKCGKHFPRKMNLCIFTINNCRPWTHLTHQSLDHKKGWIYCVVSFISI